jgi:hypothetical protein
MSVDRVLVDTNVLVYALFPTAPQHADSRAQPALGFGGYGRVKNLSRKCREPSG